MKRFLLLTMALTALAMPVRAEPGPIGNWLMNEPVSLWDRGMDRASEAARIAADHIYADNVAVSAWSHYEWNDNEITLHMVAWDLKYELGHSQCNDHTPGVHTTACRNSDASRVLRIGAHSDRRMVLS